MIKLGGLGVLVAGAFVVAAGCSSSDDTGPGVMPGAEGGVTPGADGAVVTPTSPEADEFINAFCTVYAGCCGATSPTAGCTSFLRDVRGAGRAFDATRGAACLAAVRATALKGFCPGAGAAVYYPEECADVFQANPKRPALGKCWTVNDCAAPADAKQTVICTATRQLEGVCQTGRPGKEGDRCGRVSSTVAEFAFCDPADGLYCKPGANGDACAKLKKLNEPCDRRDTCEPGAYCAFPSNTCVPKLAVDAKCNEDGDCADGLVCCSDDRDERACYKDPATKDKCRPKSTQGQPCASPSDCADPVAHYCYAASAGGEKLCNPRGAAKPGDACTSYSDCSVGSCEFETTCVTGIETGLLESQICK